MTAVKQLQNFIAEVPPSWSHFLQFQSTAVQKCRTESSRNKQFISVQLRALLSSVTKSDAVPLWPAGRASSLCSKHPRCLCSRPSVTQPSRWSDGLSQYWLCSGPLILLHNGHKAIHIPFITAHCCNCSALLLVTVVNPLRDLLYKLTFITGVYVQKKQSVCIEHSVLSTMSGSHWGSWTWPPWTRRGCCMYTFHPQQRPKPEYHLGVTLNKRRTRPHTENYVLRREMKGLRRKRDSPDSWIRRLRWLRSNSLQINLQIQCKLQAFL